MAYTPSGNPIVLTRATTLPLRNEFTLIAATIQTKLDTSLLTAATWTGVQDFSTATWLVAAPGSAFAAANKQYVDARAFTFALPSQTGNANKFATTNGSAASFAYPLLTMVPVSGTTQTATAGNDYLLTNASATTVTVPASPADGDMFSVTALNNVYTNVLAFGAASVISAAGTITGNMELDLGYGLFIYNSSIGKWVMQ